MEKLLFLHLPKAGGSTIHSLLERSYEKKELLTLKPPGVHPAGNTPLRYLDGVEQTIEQLTAGNLNNVKLIKGHFYFGLHNRISEPCKYFTFLRSPVERVISHYYFIRYRKNNAYRQVANSISLQEFVERDYEINNLQSKILSGKGYEEIKCDEELLNKAIKNIDEHFAFVGITEEFDKSLILARKILKLRLTYYKPQNVTKQKPQKINQDTIKIIEKYNQVDLQLYETMRNKFDQLWNSNKHLNNIHLIKFKLINGFAQKVKKFNYKEGF